MRRILSYVRRAVDDYGMIEDGDRIAVGVSAGKDSLTLLAALAALRRFYPKKFELVAVTVDMGFPNTDFSGIRAFCENELARVGFEKNPTRLSNTAETVFSAPTGASPRLGRIETSATPESGIKFSS